jgi:hypothetical protein
MKFLIGSIVYTLSSIAILGFLLPVSAIAATPSSTTPSVSKSGSGLAEKGKPISDRTSANCLSITKTSSAKYEVGDSTSTGRGQMPPACLPKLK